MSIEDCIAAAQNDWERRSWEIEAELADIAGQINALYGRATRLGAEAEARKMMGDGVRSLSHFFEWQLGMSKGNARQLARIAKRRDELPRTIGKLDDGLLSLDQVGPIAARLPADEGADETFAEIAPAMTAAQIRKAVRSTVPPDESPKADDDHGSGADDGERDVRHISFGYDDYGTWGAQVRANPASGAYVEASLRAHYDALWAEYKEAIKELGDGQEKPPAPTWFDAFERMVDRSLEREATDRPHSQRTKVMLHVRAGQDLAQLHLGPALSAAERALLTCDANIMTVLEDEFGVPVSVGRDHRIVPDKTRAIVEQRDGGCAIPWCGATKYLVVHHIIYWENDGPTDTWNLICLCPHHHRAVHRGEISITGNADEPGGLVITDRSKRRRLTGRSAARPPTEPPAPPPNRYDHPWGNTINWRDWIPPHIATDTRVPVAVATAA